MPDAPENLPVRLEAAGGEPALRSILAEFYLRVFDDTMIGFFFKGKDRERLIDKEVELALGLFGSHVAYTGHALPVAHAKHRILSGHFNRRQQILRETLRDLEFPADLSELWLAETETLRDQVQRPPESGPA